MRDRDKDMHDRAADERVNSGGGGGVEGGSGRNEEGMAMWHIQEQSHGAHGLHGTTLARNNWPAVKCSCDNAWEGRVAMIGNLA
jgi:hypothetical protein